MSDRPPTPLSGPSWQRLQWWGVLVAVVAGLTATVMAWLIVRSMVAEPTDLRVYGTAAQWLWSGQDPYSEAFELVVYQAVPWTNPVPAAVFYAPLSWPIPGGWDVPWLVLQIVALVGVVAVSFRTLVHRFATRRARVLLIAGITVISTGLDPVVETLILGQVNIFIVLLVLWDVVGFGDSRVQRWLRRFVPQGVAVGLAAAVKITPGLVIVWWVLTRQFRAAAWATGTIVVSWGAAFVLAPAVTWRYLADGVMLDGVRRLGDHVASVANQSLMANVSRWVEVVPAPAWMWMPAAVIAVTAGLLAGVQAYRRGNLLAAVVLVMLPALLASPIAWTHHAVWLIPAFAVLLGDGSDPRRVFWVTFTAPLWFVHTRTTGHTLALYGISWYYALLYVVVFVAVYWITVGRDVETPQRRLSV